MTKSTETVLGRILEWILQILRYLLRLIGYIFYGLGFGLGWIGKRIGKLGGATQVNKEQQPARRVEHIERSVETAVVPPSKPKYELEKASEIDVPTTRADILAVIESAPYTIFTKDERKLMDAVLTLKERPVREIMLPKDKIIYVDSNELLGPLTLDRLYQSKLLHFPVKNAKGTVIGAIHTGNLNSLEVKESFRAGEILDPNVYYIREDYTIADALDTFLRNGCYFCLVVNNYGKIVGMVNFDDLATEIFGELKIDDFKRDDDPLAVAKRRFPVEVE